MIAMLEGIVREKESNRVTLMAGGIGYGVFITDSCQAELRLNEAASLYIHEQIKEDAHDLFGFNSKAEQWLFEKLLSVKNVGPKVALAVMNIGGEASVRQAIAGGDAKLLQTAKGVGKRAAEQIVVELRDKVGLVSGEGAEAIVGRPSDSAVDEASEALMALGYNQADARLALSKIDQSLPLEQRVTMALKGMR